MKRPKILVTNDDGVSAPGILHLTAIAKTYGDVIVVAPNKPQSGMGHAITINSTLHLQKTTYHGVAEEYACSGTPVDCVKMAINHLLPEKPDLIVSGINHGSNSSINVIYSGTMSAAVEGALEGCSSIGFSLCDYSHEADFEPSTPFIKKIIEYALQHPLPQGTCFNVNIPKLPLNLISGIKVVRQAKANWVERFDERQDPYGRSYYWLTGEFINFEPEAPDTDEAALKAGYVSVVPTQVDLTAHAFIATCKTKLEQ